jgi:hypothetical protein
MNNINGVAVHICIELFVTILYSAFLMQHTLMQTKRHQ